MGRVGDPTRLKKGTIAARTTMEGGDGSAKGSTRKGTEQIDQRKGGHAMD